MGNWPPSGTRGPRRRHRSAAVTVVALAAALSGCGLVSSQASGAGESCAPPEEHPTTPGGHLLGDTDPPEAYSTVPPTSGWHTSGPPRFGVAEPPLSEAEQVTVLEQGGVVISYHGLPPNSVRSLRAFTAAHADQVALTAYPRLEEGSLALTAWGVLQRCDAVHIKTLEAFLSAHHGAAQETTPQPRGS